MLRYESLVVENVQGGMPVEKSGNLRINLRLGKKTAITELDSHRNVHCSVRV